MRTRHQCGSGTCWAACATSSAGRSGTHQKALREARETCLGELAEQADALGADAVVGVDLDYSEISGGGKGMVLLVASGTGACGCARRLAARAAPFLRACSLQLKKCAYRGTDIQASASTKWMVRELLVAASAFHRRLPSGFPRPELTAGVNNA